MYYAIFYIDMKNKSFCIFPNFPLLKQESKNCALARYIVPLVCPLILQPFCYLDPN